MNCVLITAYTNCEGRGPYSRMDRWNQLMTYTIPSLHKCVPDPKLFLIDGTILSTDQKKQLNEHGVQLFHEGDYIGTKNAGELHMVKAFVNSFNDFNYDSFCKITGRYNPTFTHEFFNNNEFIFKRRQSWMSCDMHLIETFFYKFPNSYFKIFKEKINSLEIFQDLEHSFEKDKFFDQQTGVTTLFMTCRDCDEGTVLDK